MRHLLGPVVTVTLMVSAAMANAEELEGVITEVDAEQGVIVLDGGETLRLAEGVSGEGLSPGTEVKVSFEEREDGEKYIGQIELAE